MSISTHYLVNYMNIYLCEFVRKWPLKMEGACRQGLLFQAAQGQFQQYVGYSELCVKSTELGRGAALRI